MSSRVVHDPSRLPQSVEVTASDLVGQRRGARYRVLGDFLAVNEPQIGFLRLERGGYWELQQREPPSADSRNKGEGGPA
ncbi:MAG TPA: hypothetical protein VJU80_08635 [Solirubrobacteraceae bacterium]|nr:hypothetical protein [Solirubrobacteraceae bacterium]